MCKSIDLHTAGDSDTKCLTIGDNAVKKISLFRRDITCLSIGVFAGGGLSCFHTYVSNYQAGFLKISGVLILGVFAECLVNIFSSKIIS